MKYALIIGNNQYDDPKLAQLKTPAADSQALAKILDDQAIGSFDEVTPLINQTETQVRRAISAFLINKKPDDLVLLYFSGHGVLDDRGRLYLALKDTQVDLLKATSLPSSFVADEMDSCRSKRQILILDCCHSGAFARGTKGEQKAITETTFEGSGFGRVVLTASDSTQYALEGDQVIKQTELSLFTHFLLEGLRTGEADTNNDGLIALDEWYDYTYTRVISETPRQVPHKWSYNQQGDLIIAKNPYVKKKVVELPYELIQALESPFVSVRESAVNELGKYLQSRDPVMVDLAVSSLEKMKEDDSRRISILAERLLSELEQTRIPSNKVAPAEVVVEKEPEGTAVTSDHVAFPKVNAEAKPAIVAAQADVEQENMSIDPPFASQKFNFDLLFWLKWIGISALGFAVLSLLDDYLSYPNDIVKSVPIRFAILALLLSVVQWRVFENQLGRWWIAANVMAGSFLGGLTVFINEITNYNLWLKEPLFAFWVIGNLVLGPILIKRTQKKAPSGTSLNSIATIQFMATGARQNIFFMVLSIYLILAALLSLNIVLDERDILSGPDSLKDAIFMLYGIAGVFVGVSLISRKEIPRNFGFITLGAFAFLDGIGTALYTFIYYESKEFMFLLGTISLSSGLFFISQREIWGRRNIAFILLSGYLIAAAVARFIRPDSWDLAHLFLIVSALFAVPAAVSFFLRK